MEDKIYTTKEIYQHIRQSILDCWDKSEIVGVAVLACKLLNIPNDDGNGFAEFEKIFAKEIIEWERKNYK